MRIVSRLLLIFVGVTLPLTLGVNLVYSYFYYFADIGDLGLKLDPNQYYFGLRSIALMVSDFNNSYGDLFTSVVRDWSEFLKIFNTAWYSSDYSRLGLQEIGNFFDILQVLNSLYSLFATLVDIALILISPIPLICELVVKALIGYYNVPLPTGNSSYLMEIPNLLIVPINTLIQCMN